jgi:hypothetical protein
MRVSADDVICGISASAAQELMRRYCSARPAESACGVLGICCEAAQDRLALFEAEGYLTRANSGSAGNGASWLTTSRGDALARATSGKPGRVTAGRRLEQVVARAGAYNADPGRLLTIARITVLGNGLDPAGCYGCLELAVSAVRRERDPDLYVRKVLAYARSSGRRFGAFHELIYWPDRELRMILKNRSPAISITDQSTGSLAGRLELVYTCENPGAIAPAPEMCRSAPCTDSTSQSSSSSPASG